MGGRFMKIILYVAGVLLLLACRTPARITERIDETVQRQVVDRTAYEEKFRKSVDRVIKESVDELKNSISELTLEYNRTNYSPPDSTGKQYPIQVETGKVNKKTQEDSQSRSRRDEQYKAVSSRMTQILQRMDTIENRIMQAESEYKEKLSWYQSALIFLGGIFLIYIVLTVYIKLKKP